MTKLEILEYFKDINEAYNNCNMHDTLKHMLDELEPKSSYWHKKENGCYICMACNSGFFDQPTIDQPDGSVRPAFDYCPSCGAYMEGER